MLLVVAPHPDDELLGCGGTILAQLAAGGRAVVCIASDGSSSAHPPGLNAAEMAALRVGEAHRAADVLGVDDLRFLGFADGRLETQTAELTAALTAVVDEVRPDVVLGASQLDPHDDHRAVSRALRAAAPDVRLLEYPVWFWARAPQRPGRGSAAGVLFRLPVVRSDVGRWRRRKKEAFAAYASRHHLDARFLRSFFGRWEFFFEIKDSRRPNP